MVGRLYTVWRLFRKTIYVAQTSVCDFWKTTHELKASVDKGTLTKRTRLPAERGHPVRLSAQREPPHEISKQSLSVLRPLADRMSALHWCAGKPELFQSS
jgi:hypothetical protein